MNIYYKTLLLNNMFKDKIKKYNIDNYYIDDIYTFTNEDNKYSFLLSKNGCSMIVDEYLLNKIKNKDLDENLKFKLINHDLAHLKNPKVKILNKKNKNIYFIIDVTKRCNFDCLYCFRNLDDNRIIEDKTLEDICNYILNIVKMRKLKQVKVQVWGGEPLLAINKLEYIYNFFKNTDIKLKIDVETNGSLITDAIAKKLYEMKVGVGVSIDGTKKHQDIQRRLVSGKSSYDLVKKGVSNLKKYYGNDVGGITVVTKYNYQDITEIIDYFTNELGISSMKFNLVRDNPHANEEGIGLTKEEVKWFANQLFDVVELYNLLGISFSEGNIESRTMNLTERTNYSYCNSNGCKGGKNLISIDMNGNIYPCEMMDYKEVKIGSIYQDNKLTGNNELINQISNAEKNNIYFSKKVNKECHNCPWYYYCKGGCTSRILYTNGKMKYDEIECEFNKVIYEKIIDKILKNIRVEGKNG